MGCAACKSELPANSLCNVLKLAPAVSDGSYPVVNKRHFTTYTFCDDCMERALRAVNFCPISLEDVLK